MKVIIHNLVTLCVIQVCFVHFLGAIEITEKNGTLGVAQPIQPIITDPISTTSLPDTTTSTTTTTPKTTTTTPTTPTTTPTTPTTPPTTPTTPTTSTTPTTPTTPITPTTSTTPTTPATTTPKPTVAPTPRPEPDRKFDGPSFIGGMILTMGLMAIAFVSWKFYKARTERNYHTL